MRYVDFERFISPARMSRYFTACAGDTRSAMTLYRKNLQLSQELFTIVSCFEIVLRNAVNQHCTGAFGNDWLWDAVQPGGIFDNRRCGLTKDNIVKAINNLQPHYTHSKLVAELGFGFWRYMYSAHQFTATGRALLQIFPSKPISTPAIQYNNIYVFNQLAKINDLRNRIAHHEPICFRPSQPVKETIYARQHYNYILQLFQWMSIDYPALLYGLDHVVRVCDEIDQL